MKKRAAERVRRQALVPDVVSIALQQLTLPMMIASEAMRKGLLAFVQQMGMLAFSELLAAEAEAIVGPKGQAPAGAFAPSLGQSSHVAAVWWAPCGRGTTACSSYRQGRQGG